ncbi:DUF2207 domain-containing protein [Dactylosporangium matsuzakiense]|uniref:Predicted membrane protein YciQ-like C-terminal domain-containing protein n=1 Tax=Dactylosporangium matsuzakiense TaxID=53360 RepID=A0A9W6NL77_9ACTN|nr:DUF2207 domain-containing protein [Dactylosporangium matsuzakiense]UWZ48831.1 DUF2207 domain-containing protein [Dactylosporangium matsuzakiense]GLL01064.1 hypothetical protein GCM10017581_028050 [Dactylosporangium matsuzakiense]
MPPVLLSLGFAVLVVAAHLGFVWLVTAVRSRPRAIVAGAATPELRDESPAVVNLLVNRLRPTRVASATLLDLAARRVVELFAAGDELFVRVRGPQPAGLAAHERRVFERVARVAGDSAVPLERLLQRHAGGGRRWTGWLGREARFEARRLGLVGRHERFMPVTAIVSGALLALAVVPLVPAGAALQAWACVAAFAWLPLFILDAALVDDRDRLTAQGRAAAAHWLGVAAWLRAHESLRDLPPEAVAVWDRYLAYGVALDVFQHAAQSLDFETVGRDDELWSDVTGTERLVRVRYWRRSRILAPLGQVDARARLIWSALSIPAWALIAGLATGIGSAGVRLAVLLLAALQLLRHGYRAARGAYDVLRPLEVTGTILDITLNSHVPVDTAGITDVPSSYYFIVDDGRTDRLTPWLVNRDLAGARKHFGNDPQALVAAIRHVGYRPGDRVRLVGQRYSRYVRSLRRVR